MEKELDGSESDSNIDFHIPLLHLMLKHGLLSANSKLLPQSKATTPMTVDGRPGSTLSIALNGGASVMTKSGIMKDEKDSPMRRVRHCDGKTLCGGIGLTTGLGWSDSQDEDAPSPLTRRLSTLTLSRRSSASLMRSTPTSHIYLAGAVVLIHCLARIAVEYSLAMVTSTTQHSMMSLRAENGRRSSAKFL
ncbi:hypothetical protein BDQ12DRAFT_500391 [Crucibulum laeve]|uniref:Uncharacterized protein n=1 Tax=Crucibulum laeve TaxID=68775 RepID=A0A5C3LJS4_9AGAR|nr:hypothetical protein BDQ12DRAFT_500391 [Crucibulum laeve]